MPGKTRLGLGKLKNDVFVGLYTTDLSPLIGSLIPTGRC